MPHHDFSTHRRLTTADYRNGIEGTQLRYALLACLLHATRPLTIDELIDDIGRHHLLADHVGRRHVRDALRHEVKRGRAQRDDLGRYLAGVVSPRTISRIRAAEREVRPETDDERQHRIVMAYLKRQDDERRRAQPEH